MNRILTTLALLGWGCASQPGDGPAGSRSVWSQRPGDQSLGGAGPIRFVDASAAVGLSDIHYPADLKDAKIIGTMGGGVAWGDYDGDGDPDLYVTQGVGKYRAGRPSSTCGLLFRNDGEAGFEETTVDSGIEACGWGSGALFEDVDLDGDLDLFLTFVGENQMWVNRGDGTFEEKGRDWGLSAPGYNSGAAFLDVDDDGDLDLYVTRYVATTMEDELEWPSLKLRMPEDYEAPDNALFRQDTPGRWTEITERAGVADSEGRSLGVVAVDFDRDDRPDLFVANDRGPNTLFQNLGDGTFADVTASAGVGVGPDGHWESAMGVAVADVDSNGYPDILVTNYVTEPNSLFVNLGEFVFTDETRDRGLFHSSLPWVGWGAEFVDFDNDGSLDLYVANGHIVPNLISRLGYWLNRNELIHAYTQGGYRQPVLLYRGRVGKFEYIETGEAGLVGRRVAARGSAAADVDGDGRLDLFILSLPQGSPSVLLHNQSPRTGHWVQFELRQRNHRGGALASRARLHYADTVQWIDVPSGGSYLSGSALPLHAGLGNAPRVDLNLTAGTDVATRYRALPGNRRYVLR